MSDVASILPSDDLAAQPPVPVKVRAGEMLPAQPFATRVGRNVAERGGNLIAEADGSLRVTPGRVSVEPLAEIACDDDAAPRDLDFDGDVIVTGSFRNGRKIRSTGDVWVTEAVEAARLDVGRDLHVAGGIVGRDGTCSTQGRLSCKFVSGGQIDSFGDVSVDGEVANATLSCAGRLGVSRGPILGGFVAANAGVSCHTIGNASGIPTVVAAGFDQQLRTEVAAKATEIEASRNHVRQVREKLEPLLKNERNLSSKQRERATELLWEAGELEKKTEVDIQRFAERYRAARAATRPEVSVEDTVFPGTTVRFHNIETTIPAALKGPLKIAARTAGSHTDIVLIDGTSGTEHQLESRPAVDPTTALLEQYSKLYPPESANRAKCINAFIAATQELFQTMVRMPLTLAKPRIKDAGERVYKLYKISAAICLSGALQGSVWISFSEAVALSLASSLSGEQFTKLDADSRDALGEIANMVVGSAKRALSEGPVNVSVPALHATQDLAYPPGKPIILLPFDTSSGRFIIEIALTG